MNFGHRELLISDLANKTIIDRGVENKSDTANGFPRPGFHSDIGNGRKWEGQNKRELIVKFFYTLTFFGGKEKVSNFA